MPPTQRKLIGPESSFSYKLYIQKEKLEFPNISEKPRESKNICK